MTAEIPRLRRSEQGLCLWAIVWGGLLVLGGAVWLLAAKEVAKPAGLALVFVGLLIAGTGAWGLRQPTAAILILASLNLLNFGLQALLAKAYLAGGGILTAAFVASLTGSALNTAAFGIGAIRSGRLDGSLREILIVAALPAAVAVPSALIALRGFDWPLLTMVGAACVTALVALVSRPLLKGTSLGAWRPSSMGYLIAALGLALGLGWSAGQYRLMLLMAFGPTPLGAALPPDGVSTAMRLLLLAALVPAAEEVLFRGSIQGTLTALWGDATGVLATALLFTAAHATVLGYPVLIVAALILGLLRQMSGSLLPCLVFHAVYNGVVLL